jgi:DNA polymerase-1
MQTSLTTSKPSASGTLLTAESAHSADATTSKPSASGTLLIVDGHCYAYRAYHGIASLSSPGGRPTNAIYGFIRMVGKVQGRVQPTHAVVVWDWGMAAERMALLPEYKAQRPEMPAGLATQLDGMAEYLRAAGVYSLAKEGCEADDSIAALTARAAGAGLAVVIASSDKDFMQLVSRQVKLLVPQDKTESLWDGAQVKQKTGVEPAQIVDWLSLAGDASDNIGGVPGIGLKIAADLMGQFGSIDVMYQRLPEVRSERLRTRLAAEEGTVRRNQQLIRLRESMPCELSLEELAVRESDAEELRRLYSGWGFKHLLEALEETTRPKTEELFHEHADVR